MATIRDVAALAGVSPSTVSIVINGKAPQKSIPESTVERVVTAMNTLDYHPDISARRLRASSLRKKVIAFFWPNDYRSEMLGMFLSLFQKTILEHAYNCELIIQAYVNDNLSQVADSILRNDYNGVIIGAATPKDIAFLEKANPRTPIVLINRHSEKFSTVSVNSELMGTQMAQLIYQKGYRKVGVIKAQRSYYAMAERTQAFYRACEDFKIEIPAAWIFSGNNTFGGGADAARELCSLSERPEVVYFESDFMVQGALCEFYKHDLHCPQDIEIICAGLRNHSTLEYLIPSITSVSMPSDKCAETAIKILLDQMAGSNSTAVHINLTPVVYMRESFKL